MALSRLQRGIQGKGARMDLLGNWALSILAVAALGAVTLGVALLVGRWIDAQSNSVVDEPREGRKKRPMGD